MKCDNCGYSDNGTGDWAHVCGPVKVKHYSNTNNPIDFPKNNGMNERIRELAEQAGLLPVTIGPVVETRHMKKKEQDLEKFAELIIREYSYDVMDLTSMPKHVEIAAKHWGVKL